MATFKIPCLVKRETSAGLRWYWQPSKTLKDAGWKALSLGPDEGKAFDAARARNAEVAAWRSGGAPPQKIERFAKRATVSALIKRFRAERLPELAPNTRKVYGTALNHIEGWAGAELAMAITSKNVRDLRDAMMGKGGGKKGKLSHHTAHNTLKVGRTLFQWGARNDDSLRDGKNPFEDFDLPAPPPRSQIWEPADATAFKRAAIAEGYPNMAYAVDLAAWTAQREADLIKLTHRNWQVVPPLPKDLHDRLVAADGHVMGIQLKQNKGKRWVGVPLADAMRAQTEAIIASNAASTVARSTLLFNDKSGLPWTQRNFIRIFSLIRERAITDGHRDLIGLQYRDFRRTCVVRLGRLGLSDGMISAITGHQLETTKRILETYMPRDHHMAASAIVATIGLREVTTKEVKTA